MESHLADSAETPTGTGWYLQKLREAFENKRLVVIVGQDVTLSATCDEAGKPLQRLTWTGLIRNGLDYLVQEGYMEATKPRTKRTYEALEDDDPKSLQDTANTIAGEMRQNHQLPTWLESVFGNLDGEVRYPKIFQVLRALHDRGATLLTTNYDDLLEKACNLRAIGRSNHDEILKFRSGDLDGVFHIHGSYHEPQEVVLDATDYYKVTQSDEVQNLLKNFLDCNTVLFVGCGSRLEDPNFSALLKWVSERHENIPNRRYTLVSNQDNSKHQSLLRIRYGSEYLDLSSFLCDLFNISLSEGLKEPSVVPTRGPSSEFTTEEKDCLQSLSFVEMEVRQSAIAQPLSDTVTWIFERDEYHDWLGHTDLDKHNGVLWIKGKPGSGKSVLMKQMLTTLTTTQASSCFLSFFFNARGSSLGKSSLGLFRSLIHQLLRQRRDLLTSFLPRFLKKRDTLKPGWEWQEGEIRDCFLDMATRAQASSLIIFIDALDECEQESKVRPIVTFFANLTSLTASSSKRVLVCMSSRHYPHITVPGCREIIQETWNASDIYKYVQSELYFEDAVGRTLQNEIAQKASGVFLWVVLVVTSLLHQMDQGRTVTEMRQILQSVPEELDELFTRYFTTIDRADQPQTMRLILCILFARRPLTPLELSCALTFGGEKPPRSQLDWEQSGSYLDGESHIERRLRALSKGLVEVKVARPDYESRWSHNDFRQRRVVQFIHESVREFLLQGNGLLIIDPKLGGFAAGQGHNLMTKACLNYFSIQELQDLYAADKKRSKYPQGGGRGSATTSMASYASYAFLEYGVRSLFEHAAHAEIAGVVQNHLTQTFWDHHALFDAWRHFHDVLNVDIYEQSGKEPTTLLHIVSEYGVLSCVKDLVTWGTNVNVEGGRYRYALIAAASQGFREIVQLLLDNGATKTAMDERGETALHRAAEGGHSETAKLLIKKGVPIDIRNVEDETPLHKIAKALSSSEGLVQFLTENGADLNAKDCKGMSPLHYGAGRGNAVAVRMLLKRQANYSLENMQGETALHLAAAGRNVEMVQLLLQAGSDVAVKDERGKTPLHHSASAWISSKEIVQLLLENGASVSDVDEKGTTPLHKAAEVGTVEILEQLIRKGAEVTVRDDDGVTPLHRAAGRWSIDAARLLVEKGANITARDKKGATPVHEAAIRGGKEMVEMLLEKMKKRRSNYDNESMRELESSQPGYLEEIYIKADIGADDEGWTPLHYAASRDMMAARALQAAGADIYARGKSGSTPLHQAAIGRQVKIVQWLLSLHADATVSDDEGWTPLHSAVSKDLAMAQALQEAGADIHARGKSGSMPLHEAAIGGQVKIVQWLLSLHADATVSNDEGWTPLHYAASKDLATAQALQEAGADIHARGKSGSTPLHQAAIGGQVKIVQWLLSLHADAMMSDDEGWTPLHSAASKDLATAQALQAAGADIQARGKSDSTPLHEAAIGGQVKIVQWLLSLHVDATVSDDEGWTPLHYAVSKDLVTAQALQEAGADIHARGKSGSTPLHQAAIAGQVKIVQWLLSLHADAMMSDDEGWTPLHSAASKDLAMAQALQAAGADIHARPKTGSTPLHEAAIGGQVKIVQWLLSLGANATVSDNEGWTPLHYAVSKDLATAQALQAAGADIHARGKSGSTPLHQAAIGGQVKIVRWLLSLGADAIVSDDEGWKSIHYAVSKNLATAQALQAAGADIHARGKSGSTPLHEAAIGGQVKIVQWLLSLHADATVSDDEGWTPLHYAASKDLATAQALQAAGADIHARGKSGSTPLHQAAIGDQIKIVQWLLSLHADVTVSDDEGWTPLHYAASKDLAMVQALQEAGADVHTQSKTGRTPLHEAAGSGQRRIVEWLLSLYADITVQDNKNCTPFQYAASKDLATACALQKAGADIHLQSKSGGTPLHQAAIGGQPKIVKWLVGLGGKIAAANNEGFTPLHYAAAKDLATAKAIQEAGADIHARTKSGSTPLHEAAIGGQVKVVQWLLSLHTGATVSDNEGWTPLHYAASKDLAMARALQAAGADIYARGKSGSTPLHQAAIGGQVKVVQWLLSLHADATVLDDEGWTPLHSAASKDLATTQALQAAGADIHARGKSGSTPLHQAAIGGQVKIVQWLLSLYADAKVSDNDGWTPLHSAASKDLITAQALQTAGADIHARRKSGSTPLHEAAIGGQFMIVQWLLSLHADATVSNDEGWTPLHYAASRDLATAQALQAAGADIHARGKSGSTPLHQAAIGGQVKVVQWLLSLYDDVTVSDDEGWTPLHSAASKDLAAAQALQAAGADIHARTKSGSTPLHEATIGGQVKIVQWLLSLHADVKVSDNEGWTPLHSAASRDLVMAQALETAGADIHARGKSGSTPLHQAAIGGQVKIVQWLLSLHADATVSDDEGWTPLHCAASKDLVTAQALQAAGADIHARDKSGSTPLHEATIGGQAKIVKWLLSLHVDVDAMDNEQRTALHFAVLIKDHVVVRDLLDANASVGCMDSFRRTPLHLAAYRGNGLIVQLLLSWHADPFCRDGYGRSSLEWIKLNPFLVKLLQTILPIASEPSKGGRNSCIWGSVHSLSTKLLESSHLGLQPGFHELGHCLIYLQRLDEACTAFEHQIITSRGSSDVLTHSVECNTCQSGQNIEGNRFVCTTCPDVDLCSSCKTECTLGHVPDICHEHTFLAIPGQSWSESNSASVNERGESTAQWLLRLSRECKVHSQEKYEPVEEMHH